MTDTLEAPAVPVSTAAAALQRCLNAYRREYKAIEAKGKSDYFCRQAGSAYRLAMPSTETLADIQALIARVAQGINFQVYEGRRDANPRNSSMPHRSLSSRTNRNQKNRSRATSDPPPLHCRLFAF